MEIHGYNALGAIEATIDGVRVTIPDDMRNRHRYQIWDEFEMGPPNEQGERERIWDIPPYVPPEVEPQPYTLFKSVFVRRMTVNEQVDEAAVLEGVLANAPAKLRMLYNSVEYFESDDELFDDLHAAIAAALGEQRADELLAEDIPA